MPSPPIDISALVQTEGYRVEVRPESSAERDFDLLMKKRRETFRHYRDVSIFIFVYCGISAAVILCVYELLFNAVASDDVKHWSQTILVAIATGVVSYTFGHRLGEADR